MLWHYLIKLYDISLIACYCQLILCYGQIFYPKHYNLLSVGKRGCPLQPRNLTKRRDVVGSGEVFEKFRCVKPACVAIVTHWNSLSLYLCMNIYVCDDIYIDLKQNKPAL